MDKLKTAVVGYGKVAHTHAEALAGIPESEFVAVCGRDAGKARAFADQYGVRPFTSVEDRAAMVIVRRRGRSATFATVLEPVPAGGRPTVNEVGWGAGNLGLQLVLSGPKASDELLMPTGMGGLVRFSHAPVDEVPREVLSLRPRDKANPAK